MSPKFMLGADPELFMVDAAGALVSSIGRIGGTKENPKPLPIGEGFAVQEDNVAVEYNIPPGMSRLEFRSNISKAMSYLSDTISQSNLKFSTKASASWPPGQLRSPQARTFGCDPDFNAWAKGAVNPKPRAADKNLRSCGGHLHIGTMDKIRFESPEHLWKFIKMMDLFLAVPATLMDTDETRKELYGKAGAFRYKPYGAEYRTLSNFWVHEPRLCDWAWDSTERAMDAWYNNKIDPDEDGDLIQLAVNKNNKDIASKLVDKYHLLVV